MKRVIQTILSNKPLAVVVFGFFMTIGTFIGNILLTRDITNNLKSNVGKVEIIYKEQASILQIESDINSAENMMKNFFISNQEIYLRSHRRAQSRIDSSLKFLFIQVKNSNFSKSSYDHLVDLINERKSIFVQTQKLIRENPRNNSNKIKELFSQGADKTLEIREILHKIEGELAISLEINRKYIDRSISNTTITNYLASAIALLVAFFSTYSITQDFLRQKEIEKILRNLNDEKTRLFSILGHDLRSPLSGINAVIYILKNHGEGLSWEEVKDYVFQLEQTSQNYGKLLEDVLTWSRLQLNKIQINPEPQNIKILGQEVIDLYIDQLAAKNIEIHNLISSDLILKVDKSMIQTVLRNLVSNSIKFSFTGGEIKLSYRQDKDFDYIEVSDVGVGMPPGVLKTLFTNSTISMVGTENEVGTGLGLSICKEFLSKQEGDLKVVSEENKGSVFSIVLPKEETLKRIIREKRKITKGSY
jgi:signal transduction histidine kinase